MERTLEELEAVVRDRICGVCTERTVAGECGMEDQHNCALFRLFPEVARAIQSVQRYHRVHRRHPSSSLLDLRGTGSRRLL